MTIYPILNQSAKNWRHIRQLREQGRVKEARRMERSRILAHVGALRQAVQNGGFLTNGRGGWTLHTDSYSTLSHCYPGMEQATPRCAVLLGIPCIDSTTIPDNKLAETINLPLAGAGGYSDPEPWGPLSVAPLEHVAGLYQALGATLYNIGI